MSPKDKQLLQKIRADDKRALEEVYLANQTDFLHFARKQGLLQEDALDLYQDVVIAFYQQVLNGTSSITSSIKSYLMGMGRYKFYERLRQQKRHQPLPQEQVAEVPAEKPLALSLEQEQLKEGFAKLSPSCQEVLRLFYYRGLSLGEIVEQTVYENTNTVKSHKSRCLKRLSKLINN